jgi:hypothetical protein
MENLTPSRRHVRAERNLKIAIGATYVGAFGGLLGSLMAWAVQAPGVYLASFISVFTPILGLGIAWWRRGSRRLRQVELAENRQRRAARFAQMEADVRPPFTSRDHAGPGRPAASLGDHHPPPPDVNGPQR